MTDDWWRKKERRAARGLRSEKGTSSYILPKDGNNFYSDTSRWNIDAANYGVRKPGCIDRLSYRAKQETTREEPITPNYPSTPDLTLS